MVRTKKKAKKNRSLLRKKAKKRVAILRIKKKRKILPESSENIFDSQAGKTDALFVNDPEDFDPIRDVPVKHKFFPTNSKFLSILAGLVFAGVFCSGVYVLATAWPYTAPAPLDPGCAPSDPTCIVNPPLTDGFTSSYSGTGGLTTTGIGTFGIGRFTSGIKDNAATPLLSIDAGARKLYAPNGTTDIIDWSGGSHTLWIHGETSFDNAVSFSYGVYDQTSPPAKLSIDGNERKLYASDGTTTMLNWSTAGTVSFGTQNLTTTGTGTFGTATISGAGTYNFSAGYSATATGGYDIAIGPSASATGGYGVAIGSPASAGNYSIAIGVASVPGNYSIALGKSAVIVGDNGVALGNTAIAYASSVAIGNGAYASGAGATALGSSSNASGSNSTALGFGTAVSGNYSSAIGYNFSNSTASSIAFGVNAKWLSLTSGTADFQDNNITTSGSGRFDGGVGVGVAPVSTTAYGATMTVGNSTNGYGLNNALTVSGAAAFAYGLYNTFTVSGNNAVSYGVSNTVTTSGANNNQTIGGVSTIITPNGTGVTAYGEYISSTTNTINDPTVNQIGSYIDWGIAGTDANNKKWALYNASADTTAGKVFLGLDNVKTFWGTGFDSAIYYNGTNLIIDPKVVGTGAVDLNGGNLTTTGTGTFGAGGTLGVDAATNTAGTLKLWGAGANNWSTTFTAGTQTADAAYTLPTAPATANAQALLGSTAGVLSWGTNFGSNDVIATGKGTFSGGVVTSYGTEAPTLTTNGQVAVAYVGTAPRIYFYANGGTHYIDMTAGFGIPGFETNDPISGDKMKVGDMVIGMINKSQNDSEDPNQSGLHGIWVKWDSVKAQLLAEARGELSQTTGTSGSGEVSGVSTETLADKVTNVLIGLGISIKDGVTSITQLATQKFTTDTATVRYLQMTATNGDIYCTWIDNNGDWQKTKGECGSITVAVTPASVPASAPVEVSAPTQPEAPSEQTTQQAQQIVEQAQQAANNALETSQHAEQAVQQQIQQADREIKQKVKEEVTQQLQAQQQEQTPAPAPAEEPAPVEPAQVETPVETPVEQTPPAIEEVPAATSELIQNAASGLLNGAWNLIRWVIEKPLQKLASLPFMESATASLMQGIGVLGQSVNSFSAELIGPIKYLFHK